MVRLAVLSAAVVGILSLGQVWQDRHSARLASPAKAERCSATRSAPGGRVFHVDPVNGRDDGDGSAARPWRNLSRVLSKGLIGDRVRQANWLQRVATRISGQPSKPEWVGNGRAVVRGGDTILLSGGDHGALVLEGIANDNPVTIAAAPGAQAQVEAISVADATNFTFRNLAVTPEQAGIRTFLVSTRPRPDVRPSSNIRFVGLIVDGPGSIANTSPADWVKEGRNGVQLSGECLSLEDSTIRDVRFGVSIYHANRVRIARNTIRGFSVDGVDFTGNDVVIADNVVADHWPTGDRLHPDCMQGQVSPGDPPFRRVSITGNICLSDTANRHSDELQGITIFDGRWSDVTVACNVVRPSIHHGIALYGVEGARIEKNFVLGWENGRTAWIGAFPAKDGREPKNNVIRRNTSVAYINAIHGSEKHPRKVMAAFRMGENAREFRKIMRDPITGVTLEDNAWLRSGPDLSHDRRFRQPAGGAPRGALDVDEAKALVQELCPSALAGGTVSAVRKAPWRAALLRPDVRSAVR